MRETEEKLTFCNLTLGRSCTGPVQLVLVIGVSFKSDSSYSEITCFLDFNITLEASLHVPCLPEVSLTIITNYRHHPQPASYSTVLYSSPATCIVSEVTTVLLRPSLFCVHATCFHDRKQQCQHLYVVIRRKFDEIKPMSSYTFELVQN